MPDQPASHHQDQPPTHPAPSPGPVPTTAAILIVGRLRRSILPRSHPESVADIRARVPELLSILYEDPDLLAVDKPADLVCHPTKAGPGSSLIGRVRLHLGPESRPQLVHRLDRETSGVVVLAKTAPAARALRLAWENRAVTKEYLAIVHGHPAADEGLIDAPLGRDTASAVAIRDGVRPDGLPARTRYRVAERFIRRGGAFALVQLWPETGRKHQIRIHLAFIGHPVVGDKIYAGDERLYLDFVGGRLTADQWARLILPSHALHARSVRFRWRDRERVFASVWPARFNPLVPPGSCTRDSGA